MRLKPFLFIGLLLISSILGLPVLQTALGYFPGAPGWKVAKLAAEKREVQLCNRIVDLPWGMFSMGPSVAESQFLCIHEYAKLTKDPLACELLMPSSYGLSCVGGATSIDDFCHFYNGDENVYWDEAGDAFGKTTIQSCQQFDPLASDQRNQCCLMARVRYVITENDCSPLSSFPALHDECQNNLAIKNRDPEVCSTIENENLKSACLVRVKAMKESPAVCQSCRKPVNNLSELK